MYPQIWHSFLDQDTMSNYILFANQHQKEANIIHGQSRMMWKCKKQNNIRKNIQNKIQQQLNHLIYTWHDFSFIWTLPHAKPQVWHMDSLKYFMVVNILLTSTIPTDFLDVEYKENSFDYPWIWPLQSKKEMNVNEGDAIVFVSNTIHRGPANPTDQTRLSLYITFSFSKQAKLTTDFTFPNWSWIDAQFEGSTILNRNTKQIDFLILYPHLLDLYPTKWYNDAILLSIQTQIQQRKQFLTRFWTSDFYEIEWNDGQYYLALTTNMKNKKIKCTYLCDGSVEYTTSLKFASLLKRKICFLDTLELGGYTFLSSQHSKTIQSRAILYLFSHWSNNKEYHIPFLFDPQTQHHLQVYIHSNLKYICF